MIQTDLFKFDFNEQLARVSPMIFGKGSSRNFEMT